MMNILFAASESVPFIKTGGLADVIGSLPGSFDKAEIDARVIIPCYLCIKEEFRKAMTDIGHFYSFYNGRDRYIGIKYLELKGVKYYFIDNEEYFGGPTPYGDPLWDLERFGFFAKAVLSVLPTIGFRPDIIHCHDWHTGLVPVYLKTTFAGDPFYQGIRAIMTIHNLRFQGLWGVDDVKRITGLPDDLFTSDKLEFYKDANYLKGGIIYSDAVTTVSSTYAGEIQTGFYGERLDSLLRARNNVLSGIVNGIDTDDFNPSSDPALPVNYSADTFRDKKKACKEALQRELGLEVNNKKFVIGMVSRLTDQKGLDLVERVFPEIMDGNTQFLVLGTGNANYEDMFRYYAGKYPGQVSASLKYSESLSRRIYAGTDAFLMPSLFEPCGLSQLIALRYGSVPIVRETGGLKDTVKPYNEFTNEGTGFSFTNYNAHEMLGDINYAKSVYFNHKRRWNSIVQRAMKEDFSWKNSAVKYEELYKGLLNK